MDNYKIPNTKEATSLLDELGYDTTGLSDISSFLYAKAQEKNVFNGVLHPEEYELISVAKLRDLVVLKRNDMKDATHIDRDGSKWTCVDFEKSTGHWWSGNHWRQSEFSSDIDLKPIEQTQDPTLISGADAKLAWANGIALQINKKDTYFGFIDMSNDYSLGVFDNDDYEFRLKPQTIKLVLELPKPFEPKEGEKYYLINPFQEDGYDSYVFDVDNCDHIYTQFGAYRTEDEIKKVVEQLRKIRGTNS